MLGDVVYAAAALALILRYVRGDDRIRRQMLWLLLAVGIVFVAWTVPDPLGIQTPVTLFAIALIPIAIMIAILRLSAPRHPAGGLPFCPLSVAVRDGDRCLSGTDHLAGSSCSAAGGLLRSPAIIVLALAAIFNPCGYGCNAGSTGCSTARGKIRQEQWPRSAAASDSMLRAAPDLRALYPRCVKPSGCQLRRIRVNGTVIAKIGELSDTRLSLSKGTLRTSSAHMDEPYVAPLRRGTTEIGELLINPRTGERKLSKADQRIVALLADLLAVALTGHPARRRTCPIPIRSHQRPGGGAPAIAARSA